MANEKCNFDFLHGFFAFGSAGVDVFFVLSGFILTYTRTNTGDSIFDFKTFVRKRCIRIFPIYWIIISGLLFMQLFLPSFYGSTYPIHAGELTKTFFLLPGHKMLNGVSWTLTYELFFYLLFSLSFLIKNKNVLIMCTLAYMLVLTGIGFSNLAIAEGSWAQLILFPMNIEFFLGIFIAMSVGSFNKRWAKPFIIGGFALFLFAGILSNMNLYLFQTGLNRVIYFGIPSYLIIKGVVALELNKQVKVNGLLVVLGEASYTLYLIHLPLIAAGLKLIVTYVKGQVALYFSVLILLALICFISILFYKIIEKPMIRWLNKKLNPVKIKAN